jgi:hypothetical protein
LFILSTHLTRRASASSVGLVAAQEKLESLRALAYSYDEGGAPVTARDLEPSVPSSLDEDVAGRVDWLDAAGQPHVAAGSAAFSRRWRISPVPGSPPDAIAIEVCVFTPPALSVNHRAAEACLSAIRTRQP